MVIRLLVLACNSKGRERGKGKEKEREDAGGAVVATMVSSGDAYGRSRGVAEIEAEVERQLDKWAWK